VLELEEEECEMKKICILLVVCLFSTANAALVITNGDFEINAGPSTPDVDAWYDYSTANFWEDAWQSNDSWITPNGTQVVVFCSWYSAPGEPLTGSYLYQSIGTLEDETELPIAFDWGHPDDVAPGRIDGITVSVWAKSPLPLGDDLDVASAIVLLDYASYSATAAGTDGEIWTQAVTLDLSGANAGDEILLRFNNYNTGEEGADPWPVLDNVFRNQQRLLCWDSALYCLEGSVIKKRS
jgi:hypothetical protein